MRLEIEFREERRIAASMKVSGLPKGLYLETFDYMFQPSVEKNKIDFLSSCDFIRRKDFRKEQRSRKQCCRSPCCA